MATKTAWAGWIGFAGCLMVILGAIEAIQGFFALIDDEKIVATGKGLAIIDATGWGWVHLLWGLLILLAGYGLLTAQGWARWFTIFAVGLNAIAQMAFLANYPNAYPLWNVAILGLEVVVLYALTVRWDEIQGEMP